ncbi:MAG: hypothetical protein QXG39_03295 [Candidatus Aenigmatarchaeota archaeon]
MREEISNFTKKFTEKYYAKRKEKCHVFLEGNTAKISCPEISLTITKKEENYIVRAEGIFNLHSLLKKQKQPTSYNYFLHFTADTKNLMRTLEEKGIEPEASETYSRSFLNSIKKRMENVWEFACEEPTYGEGKAFLTCSKKWGENEIRFDFNFNVFQPQLVKTRISFKEFTNPVQPKDIEKILDILQYTLKPSSYQLAEKGVIEFSTKQLPTKLDDDLLEALSLSRTWTNDFQNLIWLAKTTKMMEMFYTGKV